MRRRGALDRTFDTRRNGGDQRGERADLLGQGLDFGVRVCCCAADSCSNCSADSRRMRRKRPGKGNQRRNDGEYAARGRKIQIEFHELTPAPEFRHLHQPLQVQEQVPCQRQAAAGVTVVTGRSRQSVGLIRESPSRGGGGLLALLTMPAASDRRRRAFAREDHDDHAAIRIATGRPCRWAAVGTIFAEADHREPRRARCRRARSDARRSRRAPRTVPSSTGSNAC